MSNPTNNVPEQKSQKQAPDNAVQARCQNMPNDAEEGHYWAWTQSPQSIPTHYRQCLSCSRIDASDWIEEDRQRVETEAIKFALQTVKNISYPPSGKEYYYEDGTFDNSLTMATQTISDLKPKKKGE